MGLLTVSNWIDQVKMRDVQEWQSVVAIACTVMSVLLVARTFYLLLWKPYSMRRFYEKQGIRGPCFRPFVGNLPEIRELRASLPEVCDPSEPGERRVGLEFFVFSEKYGKDVQTANSISPIPIGYFVHELQAIACIILSHDPLENDPFMKQLETAIAYKSLALPA